MVILSVSNSTVPFRYYNLFCFISPKPRESHDYNCPSDLLWIAQPVGISCLFISSFPSTYESRQYLGTSTSGSSIAGPLVYFIPADKSNSITAPLPSPRLPLPPKATPWHFFRHYSEDACPNSLGQPGSIKHCRTRLVPVTPSNQSTRRSTTHHKSWWTRDQKSPWPKEVWVVRDFGRCRK